MCDEFKNMEYRNLPSEASKIFHDLSSQSSTVNIFQVINVNLLKKLSKSLNSNHDLLSEKCLLSLKNQCIKKFPILYERLKVSSTMMLANGKIPVGVKRLYGEIIEFCLRFYENLEVRDQDEEYSKVDKTDIEAEFFPHFPILFKRPQYVADQKTSNKDKDAWEALCSKLFPVHTQLTPGLFVMSCCCPQKKIYGFKKMIQGESPRIIFDLVTTRFDDWYNPNIIYDASCRVKEMGLNREPERFMNILITSDPLHIGNHTTCSDAFKSKYYPDLKPLNKEACEQFNSLLRNIQTSLTYMSFEHYMSAMKIFVAFHNLQ